MADADALPHWGVADDYLRQSFYSCSMPRLEDRFAGIAANNQYLFFADIHNDIVTLNTLAQPETLRALSAGGHRALASELFPVSYNPVFEAYYKGQISDDAMRFVVESAPANLEADMGVEDQRAYLARYADIISGAKAQGLRFFGVSAGEGFYDTADLPDVLNAHETFGQALLDAVVIMQNTEDLADLPIAAQIDFLSNALTDKGSDPQDIENVLVSLGYKDTDEGVWNDMGREERLFTAAYRLDQDHLVAGRIEGIAESVGGGVTSIYGGLHLWRAGVSQDNGYGHIQGDLDNILGDDNSAVISVFSDSQAFWQEFMPETYQERADLGILLENVGEYQVDIKNGRWYDGRVDMNCNIELPPGLSVNKAPESTVEPGKRLETITDPTPIGPVGSA